MSEGPTSTAWRAVRTPALLLGVFVLSTGAVSLSPQHHEVATWWPAAGVATVLVLLTPVRRWAGAAALLVVVTALANASGGRDAGVSALFGVGNALEALVAAWVLAAHRRRPTLRSGTDLARLCAAATAGAAVIAVVAGATVAVLLDASFLEAAQHVLAAHLAAQLLILPLVLSARRDDGASLVDRRPATAVRAATAVTCLAVFALAFLGWDDVAAGAFLPLPAMVWAALVLPRRDVAGLLLGVGVLTTWATARGEGPLSMQAAMVPPGGVLADGTLLAQLYLVVLFLVTVPLVLLVEQRTTALATAESVLASTTQSAIIGTGTDGRIRFFNVGAERMLGWEAAEAVGRRPDEVYLDEQEIAAHAERYGVDGGIDGLKRVLRGAGGVLKDDWTWRRKDGTSLVVSVSVTEVRSVTGELEGYLAVAVDVTDRLQVKQRLREALARERASVAELERVNRLESDFVAAVSHELRTPLTTILGNTQLLAAHIPGPLTEDQEHVVERLHRNGRRLLMLVEDLLTLTALESRVATRHVPVRAGLVTARVSGQLEDLAADRDLVVEVDDAAGDEILLGDADELERALVNLVGNAVKFTPDGGRVRLASRVEDGCVVWSVSDTGLGVSEADRAHLFERFFRAGEVTALAIPGTGLGLPVVQLVARAHGGSVRHVPHERRGSTFELSLPLARAVDDAVPTDVRLGEVS